MTRKTYFCISFFSLFLISFLLKAFAGNAFSMPETEQQTMQQNSQQFASPQQSEIKKNGEIDKIIVFVNDDIITKNEIDKKVLIMKQQMIQAGTTVPSDDEIYKEVLNGVINMQLQVQVAKKNGIDVKEDELNNAILDIAKKNAVRPILAQYSFTQ